MSVLEDTRVPAGSPDEFQTDIELAIRNEFTPSEMQAIRRLYRQDGLGPLRVRAEQVIAEETENREAYVDAMVDAFKEVIES